VTRRLRVGVIGAGSWASAAHLPALARHEVEFTAVCRLGAAELAAVKHRWGFRLASEDYRDVLTAGVDIVVVASPAALHYEHARAALRAGAHVLCEKPFTLDPAHAWDLDAEAGQAGRHLVLAYGWNCSPMIGRIRAKLAQAGIGAIEHISVTMSSATRELLAGSGSYHDASRDTVPDPRTWADPAVSGGGYGQAQLSHALALAFGLTGARAAGAFALMSAPHGEPVEFHDAVCYRLAGGGICSVSGASAHAGADGSRHHLAVQAIGSDGQLHVDVFRERASLYRAGTGQEDLPVAPGDGAYDGCRPVGCLLNLALGRTTDNPAPGELGARVTEALQLAYRSAASGEWEQRA
jgi:predicted dehydrogenase